MILREIGPYTLVLVDDDDVPEARPAATVWVPTDGEDSFNPGMIETQGVAWTFERGFWRTRINLKAEGETLSLLSSLWTDAEAEVEDAA